MLMVAGHKKSDGNIITYLHTDDYASKSLCKVLHK
jgi:hypothetical protein